LWRITLILALKKARLTCEGQSRRGRYYVDEWRIKELHIIRQNLNFVGYSIKSVF
jgi:hypothetical protein